MLEGLFLPIPGKSSGLLQSFIQFVIAVFVTFHGVLILLLEKLITWTSVASGISFKSGQFYFLWSIVWLFVRFCGIKTWIVTEIGYSTDILVYSIFYSIGLTLLLALIAFIPTLLLSRSFFLHQEIRAIHEIFLIGDFGRSFVLTIVEGWSLILYSKWRMSAFIMYYALVFIGMFYVEELVYFWLLLIYLTAYLSRVILKIFTNIVPIKSGRYTILEQEYVDLLMKYFLRTHSSSFYIRRKKKNGDVNKKNFHSSARRLCPDDDAKGGVSKTLFERLSGKSLDNYKFKVLTEAAKENVHKYGKNFTIDGTTFRATPKEIKFLKDYTAATGIKEPNTLGSHASSLFREFTDTGYRSANKVLRSKPFIFSFTAVSVAVTGCVVAKVGYGVPIDPLTGEMYLLGGKYSRMHNDVALSWNPILQSDPFLNSWPKLQMAIKTDGLPPEVVESYKQKFKILEEASGAIRQEIERKLHDRS